ncbi:Sodium/calcium exchanger membrane region [Macrophomina phaseolina MS6]|uniref:Sodium/calcium exchanger membrane region n=2 Tax=Macrophomina phaseolina TaxID=35725 RepID=K2R321_MACPH|nr:Sodium/calcium exchanger membrane region [Macrophomina phaseolina MS6]
MMYRIDTIKSRARHTAWKASKKGGNWNPWARKISHTGDSLYDEENPRESSDTHHSRAHSDTCAADDVELETRQRGLGPVHAATMPPPSRDSNQPLHINNNTNADAHDLSDASLTRRKTNKTDSEEEEKKPDFERQASAKSRKRKQPVITPWTQFKHVVFGSWVNILLLAVPAGFAVNYAHLNGIVVFVVNFIAIVPLAGMLSYATEELAMHIGETLGGLLNASFGNAVELIVGIQALVKRELVIVKTSLIGSMLSNLLLVMGMCFFLGGVSRVEQHFNVTVAQTSASLLALAVASLIIPTVFRMWVEPSDEVSDLVDTDALSRGTSVILLFVYGCYLLFQLKTHVVMYNEPSKKVEKRTKEVKPGAANRGVAAIGAGAAGAVGGKIHEDNLLSKQDDEDDDDEEEVPVLTVFGALVALACSTVLVAFCSEFMVDNISSVAGNGKGLSETFLGLILLPIVGNAAEHATAVTVAMKDKMDLAIGVAVGSSTQIALLVLPLVVLIGWIIGIDEMNLSFDGFQVAVLFVSVLLVNYLIGDGKSNWLEGMLLMTTYTIIAVAAFVYPD